MPLHNSYATMLLRRPNIVEAGARRVDVIIIISTTYDGNDIGRSGQSGILGRAGV
jgi:hypothetical protein